MDPRQNPYEQKAQMLPPPVPSAKSMNSTNSRNSQESEEWFLFYSPRSPPCMNFIAEAKKLESVRSKINLINFDDDPHSLLKDNPWLSQHGVPCLAKDGTILSGKSLFDWLDNRKRGETTVTKKGQSDNSSEPQFSHLGEEAFTGFSELSNGLSNEIATNMYSSIGAKQGSEGMDHENYAETGNTSSGLTLDNIEAERRKLN